MPRKRRKSTKQNPIGYYRQIMNDYSPVGDILRESRWVSSAAKDFEIDWDGFFHGGWSSPRGFGVLDGSSLVQPEVPLASALVGATMRVFYVLRQYADAPSFKVVADQIAAMRQSAQRLAWLAQGGNGRGPVPEAGWWLEPQSDAPILRDSERSFIEFEGRSASLHPMIQKGVKLAIPEVRFVPVGTIEKPLPEFLRHGAVKFFEQLPELIAHFEDAEKHCRERAENEGFTSKRGTKDDLARDWALIRLMWIARDVLDIVPKSYVKRISGRVGTDEPQPNSLVSFVIDAMAHIEPISMAEVTGLERALGDLRKRIPSSKLVVPISRKN